ncbi:unnamed protein product, partial [Ectocarpus sp. 12 AP-2014]
TSQQGCCVVDQQPPPVETVTKGGQASKMEAGATLRNARSVQRCNLVLPTRATRGPLMLLLESLIPQPPPPQLLLLLVVLPTLLHHSAYTPTPPQNGKTSSSSSRRTFPSSRALPVRHLDGE